MTHARRSTFSSSSVASGGDIVDGDVGALLRQLKHTSPPLPLLPPVTMADLPLRHEQLHYFAVLQKAWRRTSGVGVFLQSDSLLSCVHTWISRVLLSSSIPIDERFVRDPAPVMSRHAHRARRQTPLDPESCAFSRFRPAHRADHGHDACRSNGRRWALPAISGRILAVHSPHAATDPVAEADAHRA